MSVIEKIQTLVSQNRLVEAAKELLNTPLKEKGISLLRRLEELNEKVISDTLSNEEVKREKNQISEAILKTAKLLENPATDNSPSEIPEQEKSNKKIWQIIVGIGVIVTIVAGLFQILDLLNGEGEETVAKSLTVRVRDKRGFDELVLPSRGEVTLIYGDDTRTEQINNEGEASFRQMKDVFFGTDKCVNIIFSDPEEEPYKALYPDSCYKIISGEYVDLIVELKGIEALQGTIRDSKTGNSIEGAKIIIMGESTLSDENGYFKLNIPQEKQRKYHSIRIEKEGYKTWNESNQLIDATIEVPFLLISQ